MAEAGDFNASLLYFRKFHGYSSLKEYYEEESCLQYLHRVRILQQTALALERKYFLLLIPADVLAGVFRNNQAQYT